jgi:hypothetical protein
VAKSAEHHGTQRDLGRNVERVVRALHKPILTVTADFKEPQRVMIAFDGGASPGAASRWSPPVRCSGLAGASADVRQAGQQDAPETARMGRRRWRPPAFSFPPR